MTNAEKYLKEEINVDELIEEIVDYIDKKYKEEYEWFHSVPLFRYLNDFFNIDLNKTIKPELTEDEKVILRNIPKEYTTIRRNKWYEIEFVRDNEMYRQSMLLSHLFKFIKEDEEYSIKELLK